MKVKLKIWRQKDANSKGAFVNYDFDAASPEMSFLEMLDALNTRLIEKGEVPVAFDHDCREGICGACGMFINGHPHGPVKGITTCHLSMRYFKEGDTIVVEPWRAKAFPVVQDLIVNRSSFEDIQISGGFVSTNVGTAPDSHALPVNKKKSDMAFDAAICIGCGACVAACKNASAMLFVSAKVSQYALLPQGKLEAKERVKNMVKKMDELGFGNCTNTGACEAQCPKEISIENIARLNREFYVAKIN